jgi:hypothetical protein
MTFIANRLLADLLAFLRRLKHTISIARHCLGLFDSGA